MATRRRKHPPNPKIRRRIRAVLEWHDMSQTELAEMLDLTPASVSQFLSGVTKPHDETVRQIADGLGEDFEFLMGYCDRASIGLGQTVGAILDKATPEELDFLQEIDAGDFHDFMGEAALRYKRRRRARKAGKATLGCVAAVVGSASLLSTFAHCPAGCDCLLGAILEYFPHLHI